MLLAKVEDESGRERHVVLVNLNHHARLARERSRSPATRTPEPENPATPPISGLPLSRQEN